MRNIFTIILFIVLTFSTVSCKLNDKPKYKIGLSQCANDEWRLQMNSEITNEALLYGNIDLKIRSANGSSKQQVKDIEKFIQEGIDLLIICPNEAEAITNAVEKAYNRGIPVIVADRKVLTDSITCFVGADNFQIGQSIGIYVSKFLGIKGGNIVEISGSMTSTPAIERHNGFIKGIANNSNINILCSRDAKWNHNHAFEEMLDILSENDDINLVYSHNDEMAYGAYLAAKSIGKDKEISFIGIDALPGEGRGVSMVLSGILEATFIYPSGADIIIRQAIKILENEEFSKSINLSTAIVDKSNVQVMDLQSRYIADQQSKIEKLRDKLGSLFDSFSRQQFYLYLIGASSLITILFIIVLIYLLHQRNLLNKELRNRNEKLSILSQELEEATKTKLSFFTNISHEFKTPLTLILDPLKILLNGMKLDENQFFLLNIIYENTNILKDLVTQILDFRKSDNGNMKLNLSKVDILNLINNCSNTFKTALLNKHLKFHITNEEGSYLVVCDKQKVERIYFNLISNALKFTPENGLIFVNLGFDETKDTILFSVTNSGSFISDDIKDKIFERFFTSDKVNAGTGIGLALVKMYAQIHGGNVEVSSDSKIGTTFKVSIPRGDISSVSDNVEEYENISIPLFPYSVTEEDRINQYDKTILIVDDNDSIRAYISHILSSKYSIIIAKDGIEGFKKAIQFMPDIIVSDVIMPGIDGFELCKKLKSEEQTRHIPIIILTAYSMEENHADAYLYGADSYLSKPFNSDVLLARIQNLLESHVTNNIESVEMLNSIDYGDGNEDRTFMSQFKKIVDNNISKTDLSVDYISSELGINRVQLYRKVKTLTNYTPNEYIRSRRLKKAKNLLVKTDLSVAEVCYETGFNSPSYFSKCYKEFYNELPSDYVKRIKSEE